MFSGPKAILRVKSFQDRRLSFELPALKALQLIWGSWPLFWGGETPPPQDKSKYKTYRLSTLNSKPKPLILLSLVLERPTPCPSRKTEPLSPLGAAPGRGGVRLAAGADPGARLLGPARSSASKRASKRV